VTGCSVFQGPGILIRDGRHVDDSLAPIWAKLNDEGLVGMTMLGRHLLESGQLRDGIDPDEVRDVLWNYLAIDTYERLVLSQGWPLERYSHWLARAIISAICPWSRYRLTGCVAGAHRTIPKRVSRRATPPRQRQATSQPSEPVDTGLIAHNQQTNHPDIVTNGQPARNCHRSPGAIEGADSVDP
jgi:hypothetical protein